jgi:cysteine desulfurase
MHGAAHERGLRAGTENTPGIVGLGAAARMVAHALDESYQKMRELRNRLLDAIRKDINDVVVHGEAADRLPNTLSISFPGVSGFEILSRVPEINASTGSACHSDSDGSSTLGAMGVAADTIRGTVRLSVGWHTNQEEIERASSLLVDAWENLHQPTA